MNLKDVRIGQLVTWSSGDIQARVAVLLPATRELGVELAKPYKTPCGRTIPTGFPMTVPVDEVRAVS